MAYMVIKESMDINQSLKILMTIFVLIKGQKISILISINTRLNVCNPV